MPSVLALLNNELKEVVCTIKRNDVRLNFQCTFGTIFNGLDVDKVHGGITLKWTFTTTSSMHDEICYCFSSDTQSHIINSTSQFRFQIYGKYHHTKYWKTNLYFGKRWVWKLPQLFTNRFLSLEVLYSSTSILKYIY